MATDTLVCSNCGHANRAGAKFCARCGEPQRAACPVCGASTPDGAKFCPDCGIRLGTSVPQASTVGSVLTEEARKVVTILFTDLVGSTGLTERLDAEEVRDVVGKFYRVVQHAVERFGGRVANLLGDAVLAIFGLPLAHEDDPERAVRAAFAIRDALPALNDHVQTVHSLSLAVRLGLTTGEVVAASGSTFDRDFLVSDAVTTAARLQQTAAPGAIIVGERTHRLTRDVIEYRPLPPLEVKGKAEPLAVWEAMAPLPERLDMRRVAAPLVGRHGELGILRFLYHRCRDDNVVHLATITGQAGVGKSRLVREFLAEVRDDSPAPLILRGRSLAFGSQIGYHALIDILRSQSGLMDTDPPKMVRAKLDAWLREAAPDHYALLESLLLTFGGDDAGRGEPGEMRRRLSDAWQELLEVLASRRPVVVVMEDAHWADEGLLDLIERLPEGVNGPLLLLCTSRPELLERRPTWGAGRRNTTIIDLSPLRAQEAQQLVAALSSQGMPPEMREVIAQRAEGNPFFIEELVRMLLEGSSPGAAIPDTVQAVLTARIDRLPLHERRVLQGAAVFGRTFWASAVTPLTGMSEDETHRAIDELITKELLARRPQSTIAGQREYAFRHILTRDVAYGMLPKAQRARAHHEAARWLEAQYGARVEEVIEILAEHVRLAGDDAPAAAALARAAHKARRLYANADAVRLFTQAQEAAERAGVPSHERAAILLGRGEVHQLIGDYTRALADFERGLVAARESGHAALEATVENSIGRVYHRQMRLVEAEPHYARTVELARKSGDTLTLGLSLIHMANVAWDRGQMPADHPALAEGIDLLRMTGDASSLARGLNLLCMARFGDGDYLPAVAAAGEALAAAREAGDKSRQATSLSYLGTINSFWGKYRESIEQARAAIVLAQEIGDRRRDAFATATIGQSQGALGNWGESLSLLEESLPHVRAFIPVHLPYPLMYLGRLYDEIGSRDQARVHLDAAAHVETSNPSWRAIAVAATIILARLEGDQQTLHRCLDEIPRLAWGIFVPHDVETILPTGEAFIETGRIDEARAFLADRRVDAERFSAPPHLAAAEIVAAQLEARDGDPLAAERHLDEAVRLSELCEYVITLRRALELRWNLRRRPEDLHALRDLLDRLASSLPDELRAIFLSSPRVASLR